MNSKILITRTDRPKRVLIKKFNTIFIDKYNSTVKKYSRVDDDVENKIETNNTETNNTDGSFNLLLGDVFYDFLQNTLPEEEAITSINLKLISSLTSKNSYLDSEFKKIGYLAFYSNLINGQYSSMIDNYDELIYNHNNTNTDQYEKFTIQLEDSTGNVFSKTTEAVRSKITEGSMSTIKVPISDSQTTEKDGFTSGELFYTYYINTFSNIKIELLLTSESTLTAVDLKTINTTKIGISKEDERRYNSILSNI